MSDHDPSSNAEGVDFIGTPPLPNFIDELPSRLVPEPELSTLTQQENTAHNADFSIHHQQDADLTSDAYSSEDTYPEKDTHSGKEAHFSEDANRREDNYADYVNEPIDDPVNLSENRAQPYRYTPRSATFSHPLVERTEQADPVDLVDREDIEDAEGIEDTEDTDSPIDDEHYHSEENIIETESCSLPHSVSGAVNKINTAAEAINKAFQTVITSTPRPSVRTIIPMIHKAFSRREQIPWQETAQLLKHAFIPQKLHNRRKEAELTAVEMKTATVKMAEYAYYTMMAFLPKLRIRSFISRPFLSYHMVIMISTILTIFGLVMVQSASAVKGITANGSAYGMFTTQLTFVVLGMILFCVALRLRITFLRATAFLSLLITIGMLIAVLIPGVGLEINSSRRWFSLFGFGLQPSELVKVSLCIWGAHLLATRKNSDNYSDLLFPLIPVSLLVSGLIVLEPNLSTMIIIVLLVGALLWFAGLPLRVFASISVLVIVATGVLALSAGYRAQRVMSFLGLTHDPQGASYQSQQAHFALANGGFFGVGLGQSTSKWNYLPNEHNDFIFAVVGEELGFFGAGILTMLFVMLAIIGLRISLRSVDPFLRLLSGSISILITGQAVINIGYVVGLLPVTGVQLPLISAGGTSIITTLFLLGLLANAARHEPGMIAALKESAHTATSHPLAYLLRLPLPQAYKQTRLERTRNKSRRESRIPSESIARRNSHTSPLFNANSYLYKNRFFAFDDSLYQKANPKTRPAYHRSSSVSLSNNLSSNIDQPFSPAASNYAHKHYNYSDTKKRSRASNLFGGTTNFPNPVSRSPYPPADSYTSARSFPRDFYEEFPRDFRGERRSGNSATTRARGSSLENNRASDRPISAARASGSTHQRSQRSTRSGRSRDDSAVGKRYNKHDRYDRADHYRDHDLIPDDAYDFYDSHVNIPPRSRAVYDNPEYFDRIERENIAPRRNNFSNRTSVTSVPSGSSRFSVSDLTQRSPSRASRRYASPSHDSRTAKNHTEKVVNKSANKIVISHKPPSRSNRSPLR